VSVCSTQNEVSLCFVCCLLLVIRERIELRKCVGITINVSVVYMGQDEMIFLWATFILRALERVGPENRDLFWP
jgi:hypothetical protein